MDAEDLVNFDALRRRTATNHHSRKVNGVNSRHRSGSAALRPAAFLPA